MTGKQPDKIPFYSQGAHAVLVDFSPPMDPEALGVVTEALSQVLTLAHHMKGACRIPSFSLTALGTFPEALFPFQAVRSNYNRLMSAIGELKTFSTVSNAMCDRGDGCIIDGIQEVLLQYQRISQSTRQGNNSALSSPLEMTVLTCQSSSIIKNLIAKSSDQLHLEHVHKIHVVCIRKSDQQRKLQESQAIGDDVIPSDLNLSCSDVCSGVLDTCTVDCEAVSLVAQFKHWLHDTTTEQEHIHIDLPSSDDGVPLQLKCDIVECLLDPALIPVHESYFSILPSTSMTARSTSNQSQQVNTLMHFKKLKGVSLIDSEGVCESLVFGIPVLLRPTTCWKLDWEDLETNNQNFIALTKLLRERGQIMVASDQSPFTNRRSPPSGHFILLPGPTTSSLLVKPVVVSELYLPNMHPVTIEEPSCDAMITMENSLDKLPSEGMYNPLDVSSGLFTSLTLPKKGGSSGQGREGNSGPVVGNSVFQSKGRGRGQVGTTGTKRRPTQQPQFDVRHPSRTLGPKKTCLSITERSLGADHTHKSRYLSPSFASDDFEI